MYGYRNIMFEPWATRVPILMWDREYINMSWGASLPYRSQTPILDPQKYRMDILVPIHLPPLYTPV